MNRRDASAWILVCTAHAALIWGLLGLEVDRRPPAPQSVTGARLHLVSVHLQPMPLGKVPPAHRRALQPPDTPARSARAVDRAAREDPRGAPAKRLPGPAPDRFGPIPHAAEAAPTNETGPPGVSSATDSSFGASEGETPAPPTPTAHGLPRSEAPSLVLAQADRRQCPAASHPSALRERGIEGAVLLRVKVDPQGRAADVQLLAGSGWRLFDEAAVHQVRGCRFIPATLGGQAVDSWVEFPVRFALAG